MKKDVAKAAFLISIKPAGIPAPEQEYRFHPVRRWRFDFAWPIGAAGVALEVEGGVWIGGRHTSGAGFVKDMEKYNTATRMGWRVLRCQPGDLALPGTLEMLKDTIGVHRAGSQRG